MSNKTESKQPPASSFDIDFDSLTERKVFKVAIKSLSRDGMTAYAYFRELSAGEVMEFAELPEDSFENKKIKESAQFELLQKAMVKSDGVTPVYPPDATKGVRDLPIKVFLELIDELMKALNVADIVTGKAEPGKDSSSAPSDDSPTGSPSN